MKINVNNREKIEEVLGFNQKRASVRCCDYRDVMLAVSAIEERLSVLLLKRDWQGVRFVADPHASTFAFSYRGIPISTKVALERGAASWFLCGIYRGQCSPPSQMIVPVNIEMYVRRIKENISKSRWWSK